MASPPLYLAGQTGCGKTAVSLALAELLSPVEIINADAYQIYRGMEILTAAPTGAERRVVPHHLFGILPPEEACDAASFARQTRTTIAEIGPRAIPLVVGGSGLYLKAVTHGLGPTPPGDPALRAELDRLALDALVAWYRRLDPEGAERTDLRNRRYVSRNIEISLLTGEPASQRKDGWRRSNPEIRGVFLRRDRADLRRRILHRTEAMFEAGVIDEVAALAGLSATAEKAIGLREIRSLLAGEIDEDTCRERIVVQTARYAKRQEAWFKREPGFVPIAIAPGESPLEIAVRVRRHFEAPGDPIA